jgi:hypothetical protein
MLPGFTSRCSTPAACAVASASAMLTPTDRTSSAGSGPPRCSRSTSEPRLHSSITRYGRPSSVTPAPYTATMWACEDSRPAAFASRRNRRRCRSSDSTWPPTFSATSRPTPTCHTRYTVPNPPRPSGLGSSSPSTKGGRSAHGSDPLSSDITACRSYLGSPPTADEDSRTSPPNRDATPATGGRPTGYGQTCGASACRAASRRSAASSGEPGAAE